MDTIKKLDIKRYKYKESKTKTFPPNTIRYCNYCQRETEWNFNPITGHSQCSNCGLRKVPILKNLIDCECNIIKKDKDKKEKKEKKEKRVKKQNKYKTYQNRYQFQNQNKTFLTKLLNKKIRCILTNSITLEGILIDINQYEIVLMIESEKVMVFKKALLTIVEINKENQ